jgi:hypothetical protein
MLAADVVDGLQALDKEMSIAENPAMLISKQP